MMLCLTQAQKQWSQPTMAETSETMRQNKPFLLINCFSQIFAIVTKKKKNPNTLTKNMKDLYNEYYKTLKKEIEARHGCTCL
jgi:cobyric acid synthase